jgi:phosphomannomutase / phosphoglucomutase
MALFREYDIRGVVGQELTESIAEQIGRAYATVARAQHAKTVTVGRDGRDSSPALRDRLIRGLTASGLNVIDIGIVPTPVLYFSLFHLKADGGVMITGSHNAAEYNGFKLCLGKEALHGKDIQQLKKVMEAGNFSSGTGQVTEQPMLPEYLAYLKQSFAAVKGGSLHVVIDCGNGAAGLVAEQAMAQLGCRVTGLYCDVDGSFPNHHPDPTVVDNLQDLIRTVKETKADVGIGYDGDADRIGAVDEQGNILWGDRLMVIFSRDILASRPGSTIMWKTGHSLIKAKMKEESAVLAGEMSGHMFFADRYFGYDDAIYASCRLIEILAKTGKPLSSLIADLPRTAVTPEIRVDCPDTQKFELVTRVQSRLVEHAKSNGPLPGSELTIRDVVTIDGIRVSFDDGWGLIRASNTQPALVLRFEASTPERLAVIRTVIESELESAKRSLEGE